MTAIALPRVTFSPEAEAAADRLPGPLIEELLQRPDEVQPFGTASFILSNRRGGAFVQDHGADGLNVVDIYLRNWKEQ